MNSLFISNPLDIDSNPVGGVQLCSQEFLEIVQKASISVDYVEVNVCLQILWRLRRKLNLGSYLLYSPEEVKEIIVCKTLLNQPTHIFLNKSELVRLTPILRELFPSAKIVLMSHGNQSGDDLYELAGDGGNKSEGLSKLRGVWQIGQDLVTESWFRHRYIDCVCVMSEEEAVLERWLGAKKTIVLPRTITAEEIPWKPQAGRVGFVGTLNHTPNRIALEQICKEISRITSIKIELRLVGRPESHGQYLASQFGFVSYLGALDDEALKSEISTWNLFLNPIFWLSRGASMKLGKAISWGIPFITTESGRRGYELREAEPLTTADNAQDFVARIINLMNDDQNIIRAKAIVKNIQINSPTIQRLANVISITL